MASTSERQLLVLGCGYIGTAVANEAVSRGYRVTALTRNPETARQLEIRGVRTVVADLVSDDWHTQVPRRPEFVLNCVSAGGGGLEAYRRNYVEGMQSVRRWAGVCGPLGTLVYTSSTSVYPQDGGAEVDERASHDGVGERGALLLEAEEQLRALAGRADALAESSASGAATTSTNPAGAAIERFFILRLAGIYGPGRHHVLDQVRAGVVAGRGDHRLNLIHRDDVCRAVFAAFAAPAECRDEVLNLADDEPAKKADVVEWLARRIGVPPPSFSGLPAGTRRALTPDRVIQNGKIKRELGWRPQYPSYREGYENILSRAAE